jgi:hypothetical protein
VGRRGEPAVLAEENQRMGVIKLREEGWEVTRGDYRKRRAGLGNLDFTGDAGVRNFNDMMEAAGED